MLVENSTQAIADIVEKLNSKALDWDARNQHTGYYVNTILRDLHAIVSAAAIDHVAYQQAQKNAKLIEAKTIAFVNKMRVKNTTVLTQESLDRVATAEKTATANEKDYLQRQKELEATVAKQIEEFNAYVKSQQQKNLQGSSSAQWPQHKQKATKIGKHQWIPPQTTMKNTPAVPNSPPKTTTKPDDTTEINANSTTEVHTNSTKANTKRTQQKNTKKRKISQKK
jgi:uncharacterized membrane protein